MPDALPDAQISRNLSDFTDRAPGEVEESRWQREKIELIKRTISGLNRSGRPLADVGCFTGLITEEYRALGFSRAVGFDGAEGALAAAAARGIDARRWTIGSERCPASSSEFDVVIAADVIEHIVDTDHFMGELSRILVPYGFLIITTPNLASWRSRIRLLLGKPPCSSPGASPTVRSDLMIDLNHIRVTTSGEWQALFRAQGFKVCDIQGYSLMHAVDGGPSIAVRKIIDRYITKRFPSLAFGLMFLLRKSPI